MTIPRKPEIIAIERLRAGHKRRYSAEEKQRLLLEAEAPGESLSSLARRYGVTLNLMFRWRKLQEHGYLESIGADERRARERVETPQI